MSKPRELKLKVHKSAFGVNIVYDAAVSSWMFKEGEYALVEKSAYDAILAQNKLLVEALEFMVQSWNSGITQKEIYDRARQALSKVKGEE